MPQELIDKAAILGCEIWEIDEVEERNRMREAGEGEEDDSDEEEGGR